MAKRSLDDATSISATEVPAKKSRKEKKRSTTPPVEEKDQLKKARKEKKRQKKELKDAEAADQLPEPAGDDDEEAKAARKAARKVARKAEKAALKAQKATETDSKDEPKSTALEPGTATTTTEMASSAPTSGRYVEPSELASLPSSVIDTFLADNFISVSDPTTKSSLRPIIEFSHLPAGVLQEQTPLQAYKKPTPIQSVSWPFLFDGRDVIGVAETGSGKTMAFSVPCIRHLGASLKGKKHSGIKAVVVSPTRELAMQSFEQITNLTQGSGLKTVCVYGGVPKDEQRRALQKAHIVIATPGRLNDFISEGCADLSQADYVVLDEADRMLDKGFEEDIRKIIGATAPLGKRQTLMFTATWPESVRKLAATFMTSPVKISIGDNPTGDLRANARIVQKVEVLDARDKQFRLLQLLKQYQSGQQKDDRILVFCLYKKEATRIEEFIRNKGIRVAGIHGDLSQEQRTRSLDAFKKGTCPVLVATDVAARGLDIPAVKLVINCTFPLTVEDYVHRIGRTGRAGKEGLAITLFTEHDKAHSGALINVLKSANQPVPDELMKFGTTVKKKGHEAYGAFYKETDSTKTATKIKFD